MSNNYVALESVGPVMDERLAIMASALFFAILFSLTAARRGDRPKYLTAYACEGTQLHISCNEGYLIDLIRANYGRFSIGLCNDHGNLDWSVDCTSLRSYYVIYESCAMKNSCSLPAASAVFGDPCPGTLKYLEAHYNCQPESMTTTTTSTTSTTTTTTTTTTRPPIIIPLTRFNRPSSESISSSSTPKWTTTSTEIARTSPLTTEQTTSTTSELTSLAVTMKLTTPINSESSPLPTRSSILLGKTEKPLLYYTTHTTPVKDKEFCHPIVYRNLSWDWTKSGTYAIQKCPGAAVGEARWQCGTNPVRWVPDSPDLSQCSSLWVDNLRKRVDGGDSVVNIAAELAVVTHRKPLYGGDVRHATEIVQRLITKMADKVQDISDDKQRHQVLKELLESVVEVTNNLFEVSQKSSWGDLPSSERRHVASILLESLEHSGWLLAVGQRGSYYYRRAHSNVLFSVRVVEAWAVSEVKFPTHEDVDGTLWSDLEDSVHLPTQALLGSASNGVVKMVFAAYKKVEDFLGSVSSSRRGIVHNSSHIVNSRVISASTGRYPGVKLAEPVTVTFRLVQRENVTNPQCVYWDLDTRLWSVEGCWLRKSNATHAVCACDHLTNFALLMEVKATEVESHEMIVVRVVIFVGCAASMILYLLTALLLQIFSFPNDYSTIHKHLCVCLLLSEAVLVAGMNQVHQPLACAFLAGALHLTLQASIVWLFLASFQLYVLLLGPAHSSKSRIRCYCLVAYGMSALIVSISAIIDPKSYGTSNYCFLRFDNYYVFSFVGPVISCIVGAALFLGLTFCRTCWFSMSSAKHKELFNANAAKIRSRETWLVLLTSTGTWTFLLLFWDQRITAFACLFTVFNCLQSTAVFLCFGLRNEEVRQAYRRWQHGCAGAPCGQQQQGSKNEAHHPAGQFVLPATSSQHSSQPPSWSSATSPRPDPTISITPTSAIQGLQSTAMLKNWQRESPPDDNWYPSWRTGWQQSEDRDLAFLDLLASSQRAPEGRFSNEHIYECIDEAGTDVDRQRASRNLCNKYRSRGRDRWSMRLPQHFGAPYQAEGVMHPDVVQSGTPLTHLDSYCDHWSDDIVSEEALDCPVQHEAAAPPPQSPLRLWEAEYPSHYCPPAHNLQRCENVEELEPRCPHS